MKTKTKANIAMSLIAVGLFIVFVSAMKTPTDHRLYTLAGLGVALLGASLLAHVNSILSHRGA